MTDTLIDIIALEKAVYWFLCERSAQMGESYTPHDHEAAIAEDQDYISDIRFQVKSAIKAYLGNLPIDTSNALAEHKFDTSEYVMLEPRPCCKELKELREKSACARPQSDTLIDCLKEFENAYSWLCPEDQGKAFSEAWEKHKDSLYAILNNEHDSNCGKQYGEYTYMCEKCSSPKVQQREISYNADIRDDFYKYMAERKLTPTNDEWLAWQYAWVLAWKEGQKAGIRDANILSKRESVASEPLQNIEYKTSDGTDGFWVGQPLKRLNGGEWKLLYDVTNDIEGGE